MSLADLMETATMWAKKLAQMKEVRGVYVYGSLAHGDVWEESNVDMVAIVGLSSKDIHPAYVDLASEDCAMKIEFVPLAVFNRYTALPPSYDCLVRLATISRARALYDPDGLIATMSGELHTWVGKRKAGFLLNEFANGALFHGYTQKYHAMERWKAAHHWSTKALEHFGLALLLAHDTWPKKSWVEELEVLEPDCFQFSRSHTYEPSRDNLDSVLDQLDSLSQRLAPVVCWALGQFVQTERPLRVDQVALEVPLLSEFGARGLLESLVKSDWAHRSHQEQPVRLGQLEFKCLSVTYTWEESAACRL